MLKYILPVVIAILASTLGAQTLASENQQEETTIVGCLQTGTNADEFILVDDEKQAYQIQAGEGVDLAPHANHRVELTGKVEKNETSVVLQATPLKMVAAACEP